MPHAAPQSDTETHANDNLRIMQSNMALIKEIQVLRRDVKTIKLSSKEGENKEGGVGGGMKESKRGGKGGRRRGGGKSLVPQAWGTGGGEGSGGGGGAMAGPNGTVDAKSVIDEQRIEIGRLKEHMRRLEDAMVANRPVSREKLPPMDGAFNHA